MSNKSSPNRTRVKARIWRRANQNYLRPFAKELGLRHRSLSKLLQRRVGYFGWDRSFVKASGGVLEHYGFELPPERIGQCSLEHAQQINQRAMTEKPATVLKNGGVDQLLTEEDGLMIRLGRVDK